MSDGFQGNAAANGGSSAPDMPPLIRPPVPEPAPDRGDAVHLPFRRQDEHLVEPTPTPAEELAILDVPVAEPELEPVLEAPPGDQELGPTGRPMPFIPEPRPVTTHGNARVISMCNQKGGVGKIGRASCRERVFSSV